MLVALDVGNTDITVGVFEGERLARKGRIPTDPALGASALASRLLKACGLPEPGVSGSGVPPPLRTGSGLRAGEAAVAAASVVPRINASLKLAARRAFGREPVWITPASPLGIALRVKRPREVGADRVANAVAAARLYGAPAVVLDFGTATTFDCVSRNGDYLGGAILPGPDMASRALAEFTAQLPRVAVRKPRRAIGRDTVECIEAGLYFGYLGMIEKVLGLTLREMGSPKATLLATGGLAGLFKEDLPRGVKVVPDLTLQGVRIAFEIIVGGRTHV